MLLVRTLGRFNRGVYLGLTATLYDRDDLAGRRVLNRKSVFGAV
jgi:hypothetical protein